MSRIFVLGSINMDMTIVSPRMPELGETLAGSSFSTAHGGKGANQAVACSRLGAETWMCGCVGNDSFGAELKNSMISDNINADYIKNVECSTGVAVITLVNGDNTIIVSGGANGMVTKDLAEEFLNNAEKGDIFLTQLETNLETVKFALEYAKKMGMITVLNPAPANGMANELCEFCDYIIPNEFELEAVSGIADIEKGLKTLKSECSGIPIVTLGSKGCAYISENEVVFRQCKKVKAVDTTGAGDTFCGAFCVSLSQSEKLQNCIDFAMSAASLSVTKRGAQPSIPFIDEL